MQKLTFFLKIKIEFHINQGTKKQYLKLMESNAFLLFFKIKDFIERNK